MIVDENCGICNEKVKETGYRVYGCECCPKWLHAKCIFPNASEEELKILFKYNSGFDVKCNVCKQAVKSGSEKLENSNKIGIADNLKKEFCSEIKSCLPDLMKEVLQEANATNLISKTYAEIVRKKEDDLIQRTVRATTQESLKESMIAIETNIVEKEKRHNNIIVSGLNENISDNSLKSEVFNICKVIENNLQLNDIVKCKRIGLPKTKSGRSRLVLVIMRYKEDALKLHNWGVGTKINAKDPIWINPDLTKTERNVRFRLRLKKRNAKKVNEEKKVADLNEDKCATNPGSVMQALQMKIDWL